jgi:hypothetical protein
MEIPATVTPKHESGDDDDVEVIDVRASGKTLHYVTNFMVSEKKAIHL